MVSLTTPFVWFLRFNRFRGCLQSSSPQTIKGGTVACVGMHTRSLSSSVVFSEIECDDYHNDIKAMEKDATLRLALSRLASDFGRESMLSMQHFFSSRHTPVISTGSLKLDLALGIGGLPKGRMVEIYGQEASGKTTLALHIIKEAQKHGGYCAYLDAENAMNPSFAESMGVDIDNLLIAPPDSAENLLSVVNTLTKSGSMDVIVIDSVAALVPQRELDVVIGHTYEDVQSQIMAQALRKIHYSLCRSKTLIVFVNQVRSNLKSGQGFGRLNEVTCGGNALRFYAAVRMRVMRTGLLMTDDKVTGLGIRVQVVKNKLARAMKNADLGIQFGRGICFESEVLESACEHGVILKEGSKYIIEGEVFNDRQEAEQHIVENNGVLDRIVSFLRSHLF